MGIICRKICFEDKFHTLALHCSMYCWHLFSLVHQTQNLVAWRKKKPLIFLELFSIYTVSCVDLPEATAVTHLTLGSLEIRQNLDTRIVGTPPQYVRSPMGSNVEVPDFPKTWNWPNIISTALCDCSWPQSELSSTGDESIVCRYLELQITGATERISQRSLWGQTLAMGRQYKGAKLMSSYYILVGDTEDVQMRLRKSSGYGLYSSTNSG